jgi:hypothetical protein
MIGEYAAICGVTPETVLAMNGLGGMVLGPIEGYQQRVMKHPQVVQQAVSLKPRQDRKIHAIEVPGQEWIKPGSYLMVTGDLLHATEGTGVILPLGLLEVTLGIQQRRRLGRKETKSAQGRVFDGGARIGSWCAMRRQRLDSLGQDACERLAV